MKYYQYGFIVDNEKKYLGLYAKTFESALRQAKAYIKEVYGSSAKICSLEEIN